MSEAEASEASPRKPPRRWLAFLLNFFLPPAGYVYAGALRTAVGFVAILFVGAALLTIWTFWRPPGVYVDLSGQGPQATISFLQLAIALGLATHAALIARQPRRRPGAGRLWLVGALLAATPLVVAFGVRAYGPVSVYSAASASNQPGLAEGDIVAVRGARALCGGVKAGPGDMIVHRRAKDPKGPPWMKRVVAMGGSTVEMRAGRLVIDGKPVPTVDTGRTSDAGYGVQAHVLRETLPGGASYEIFDLAPGSEFDTFGPLRVPAGTVFALGDNRDNSIDSRIEGPIPERDVCGIVFKILSAKDPARIGKKP